MWAIALFAASILSLGPFSIWFASSVIAPIRQKFEQLGWRTIAFDVLIQKSDSINKLIQETKTEFEVKAARKVVIFLMFFTAIASVAFLTEASHNYSISCERGDASAKCK